MDTPSPKDGWFPKLHHMAEWMGLRSVVFRYLEAEPAPEMTKTPAPRPVSAEDAAELKGLKKDLENLMKVRVTDWFAN